MAPETLNKHIPVIDFSRDKLNPGTNHWFLIRNKVRQALEEYGCFEAVYDNKINPLKLHNEVFGVVKELFDLPLETKIQNTSDKPYYGYVGQTSVRPLMESMGIDDAPVLEQVQSFTNLMWPEGNDNFCETVHSFAKRVTELEQMVTRMIFESYGVEKYYNSHIESMNYLLRVLKYRSPRAYETKLGATPHTDKSFITILHQNQVNGLDIQTKNGEWIRVIPSASSFVVMIGDAFLAWSNGRLRSPHHRVVLEGECKTTRYSIGLFGFSRKFVEVPKELVDEKHPLLFKPFCQMGLMNFLSTEEGEKAESTVKTYCGI